MRWIVLAMLALMALAPAQAVYHADETNDGVGNQGNGDDGDTDVTIDNDDDDTTGAGRDDGGGMSTPWTILMVLGVLVVIGVIVALLFAARDRPPRY